MPATIIIKGIGRRIIFFDERDRQQFRWSLSLLPHHMANDLCTFEHCCDVVSVEFSSFSATVTIQPVQWTPAQVAKFLCMVYDSYYRRRYHCDGKQCEYRITEK